jgi:HD-like signal output (HDOD) protein
MIAEDAVRADVHDSACGGAELLERLLERSMRLYSLPTVAVDLLALTGNPRIGAAELKECIERDPALTAKILRVVNSSLYGLSAEVASLGQAVALLGIKPLKLLVLGFSLPDDLFTSLAGEQLERYWATSLVRAVAAKAIAEQFYHRDGDDAFIAGLMEDIGMLAMLGQLGEPYARFLQIVWDEEGDVRAVERQALGFDHGQLTAALLAQWKMPEALVKAVAAADLKGLAHPANTEPLPRILYLANLMAGLVGRHRLNVLPELLERGTEFCGLDKDALHVLVEDLEPKVADLAGALDVRLAATSYLQILADAQARLAELGEEIVGPLARLERAEKLLNQVKSDWSKQATAVVSPPTGPHALPSATPLPPSAAFSGPPPGVPDNEEVQALRVALGRAVAECRATRDELAVALVGAGRPSGANGRHLHAVLSQAGDLLRTACRQFGVAHAEQWQVSETAQAVVLPHCTRREAINLVRQVLANLQNAPGPSAATHALSAGVASVDTPPRNFDPVRLLESAQRCLFAAEASGGQVKSIELY